MYRLTSLCNYDTKHVTKHGIHVDEWEPYNVNCNVKWNKKKKVKKLTAF